MQELLNKLFGPLDSSYCTYFYFISVFAFFSFIGCILSCLYSLVNKTKTDMNLCIALGIQSFFGYFMNRLLYSMCVGSLG